jgi:predicted GIY-YIG superfamily endonuclease
MQNIILVAELRQLMALRQSAVEKRPGVYRWWFPKDNAEELLSHFKNRVLLKDEKLQERKIKEKQYVALYFGISNDMSRRIRWHIRGPFRSSTLRRTLRAILAPNDGDDTAASIVNQWIDKCFWEWDYTDMTEKAEQLETAELTQQKFAYPLNISKNETMPAAWIAELKNLRANSPH